MLQPVTLAAIALLVTSCVTPTPLVMPAPPGTLSSAAERETYVRDHGPLSPAEQRVPGLLMFADGQKTSDPRELLGYVDARSPTATAAKAAEEHEVAKNMLSIVGTITFSAGSMAVVAAPMWGLSSADDIDVSVPVLAIMGAGSLVALGSAFLFIPAMLHTKEGEVERNAALLMFPRDLRRKLDLPAEPSRVAVAEAEQE